MAVLVACIGEGKGTWTSVFSLASMPDWEAVVLIGNAFAKDKVTLTERMRFIEVDDREPVAAIRERIEKELGPLFGEVGLSLISGNGALHMATLSAVLRSGGGIRLVNYAGAFEEI